MLTSGSLSLLEMLKFFLEIEMVLKTRNNIKNGVRACVRACVRVCVRAYVRVCVCVSIFLSPGQLLVLWVARERCCLWWSHRKLISFLVTITGWNYLKCEECLSGIIYRLAAIKQLLQNTLSCFMRLDKTASIYYHLLFPSV